MKRQLFRVTCKVALYDFETESVLIVEYKKNEFGLPGGHLDLGEVPEDALRREIKEELGIDYNDYLVMKDSWIHTNGKLIIGFVGKLSASTKLKIDPVEVRSARWAKLQDVRKGVFSLIDYKDFILEQGDILRAPSTSR